MKKTSLMFFASLFMAASAVHAQSLPLKADIPFDFVVGNSVLHAGKYTIRPMDGDGRVTLLRSVDLKHSSLITACPCASRSSEHDSELVFKVIGDRYYLWQIWTADYQAGRELSIIPRRTEAAKTAPAQAVAVKVSARA